MTYHPSTRNELDDFERFAHETGLRHEALLTAWNERRLANVEQFPPEFKPKISLEAYLERLKDGNP